jgi:hypothetical protein
MHVLTVVERLLVLNLSLVLLGGACLSAQSPPVQKKAKKKSTTTVPITASPPYVISDCSPSPSFVPLKSESTARFNVANSTTTPIKVSKLKYEGQWVVSFTVDPHGGVGIGVDYAEEIWRIEDGAGTCLAVVRPVPGPMAMIEVGR